MSSIPHNISDRTITVFLEEGPITVDRDSHVEAELRDVLASDSPDLDRLRLLLNPAKAVEEALDGTGVCLIGNTVTYRGKAITGHLAKRIIDLVANGHDVTPWKRFVQRVYANPLRSAREELGLFLEDADLPITADGCFLAYKRVNTDFTDCHTGKMDNSVGQLVLMPGGRSAVDTDRDRTCSTGLHFCSKDYLRNFLSGRGKIVVVKVDPADVVAIPSDYQNTKGRAWKYEVVGEIATDSDAEAKEWGIINTEYDEYDEDGWDDIGGWDEDDIDEDEWQGIDDIEDAQVPDVNAWQAPTAPRRSFWKSVSGRALRII